MAASSFDCPYCCSAVPVAASVCAHCGRDLVLFRPLALRMHDLADEVAALRDQVARLHEAAAGSAVSQAEAAAPEPPPPSAARLAMAALALLLGCVLATALAHWLLLFVYDAPPTALRIVTLLLPAGLALAMAPRLRIGWQAHAALSLLIGGLAVAVMLGITALLDGVPWWPQTPRDLREVLEYMTAIALSSWTGQLLFLGARARARRAQARRLAGIAALGAIVERDPTGRIRLGATAQKARRIAEAVAPVVSGAMAFYSGLKSFFE